MMLIKFTSLIVYTSLQRSGVQLLPNSDCHGKINEKEIHKKTYAFTPGSTNKIPPHNLTCDISYAYKHMQAYTAKLMHTVHILYVALYTHKYTHVVHVHNLPEYAWKHQSPHFFLPSWILNTDISQQLKPGSYDMFQSWQGFLINYPFHDAKNQSNNW